MQKHLLRVYMYLSGSSNKEIELITNIGVSQHEYILQCYGD